MCFDDAWINSTIQFNANKKLGFLRCTPYLNSITDILITCIVFISNNITTYYVPIDLSSSGIVKEPPVTYLSRQGLRAKIMPFGGFILGVTAYDNNDNKTYHNMYVYNGTIITLGKIPSKHFLTNITSMSPERLLTNYFGVNAITQNNTFLLASPYTNDNISWSLLTIPLSNTNYDHGYDNAAINKTIPPIDANVNSSTTFLNITFNVPLVLSTSTSNITIYKASDNSIRQRVSVTMHDFCILNSHGISIKVINSTFNEYDEQYFVSMDNNFVKEVYFNEPLKGIHDGIWTLKTHNAIEGSVRLTQKASKKFLALETNKSAYIDNLFNELADKVPINRSCLRSDNKFQVLYDQIFIFIRIVIGNNEIKRTASEIFSDLNTMIIYKNITAFSFGVTNDLDQDYGFKLMWNVWNDHKVQIAIIVGVMIFIIFCLLFPILGHKLKSKKFEVISSAILRIGLIIPNFILSVLFVVHESNNVPEFYMPSVLVLGIPLFINFYIAAYTIYKGIKNPVIGENFKKWVMKYRGSIIILIILAATDYEYLTILKDIPMFTKKSYCYKQINIFNILEHIFDIAIMWGAFIDIFFRNIPQIIIQVCKFHYIHRYEITFMS
ncbi:hypothetical protein F8M41_011541 [Gigaspora margarita]|uniref:Uncharacterized protein n=1 Tax=Gigaspora margarita TaxID=4874 RepID=A0A8H4ATQ6_GIGMA|nr:hypothetical protein F8M41_011541 [Gigaspora margarita]